MKNILNYIAVVTAAALLAPSCSTDGVDNIPEGQGLITMNVETGTRAEGNTVDLDQCTVGIYDLNQEGALVRKYAKGNCPEQIALVAGRYQVKVQYGEKPAAASFDKCYYEGLSQEITLAAGSAETANVECLPQSLAVAVNFAYDFAEIFDSYSADVTLGEGVENGSLNYTENKTGYFTLPEDVTEMKWTFTGKHKTKGTINKSATFGVEMGKKYALSFKFSPDMPGYITTEVISIEVKDPIEHGDEFNFSNDPEITSTNNGFFFEPQVYAGEAMTVQVSAQAEITKLSVEAAGQTIDLMNPADKATAVFDSSRTGATITLNPSFFDFACGDMPVTFKVEDLGGGQAEKTATIRMAEGILPVAETDYNLWTNSVTLRAKSNGAAPVFKLRTAGQTEWQTVNGTLAGDEYVAVMNPEWISSQNENNLTVYSPRENTGVWAGGSYEAMVEFDGRTSKTSFSTRGGDVIPNGDMENTGASCYSQTNSDESSVIWGSGNNFMTGGLCQPAQFDGMGGANCSVLTAAAATSTNLAAGNLFLGTFTMAGTNGTVDFGIRYGWTARPKGLRFKYHATVGTVNFNKYNGPLAKGEQDQMSIYFAILNWSTRHGVTSGLSSPSGIWSVDAQSNLEGSGPIIAYGTMVIDTSTAGNTMVEGYIPINFYDTAAGIPDATYTLTIACSTSRYGDYMNGCDSNVLYVDDFEWVY